MALFYVHLFTAVLTNEQLSQERKKTLICCYSDVTQNEKCFFFLNDSLTDNDENYSCSRKVIYF